MKWDLNLFSLASKLSTFQEVGGGTVFAYGVWVTPINLISFNCHDDAAAAADNDDGDDECVKRHFTSTDYDWWWFES
jgi:hypothetical protein